MHEVKDGCQGLFAQRWGASALSGRPCKLDNQHLPIALPLLQAVPSCTTSAELAIPLHARYPHPQQREQHGQQAGSWWGAALAVPVITELLPPLVLVQCPGGRAGQDKEAAQWQLAQLAVEPLPQPVRWDRPAGNLQHGPLVAGGTAAALVLGAVAVLRALWQPLDRERLAQHRHKGD